MILAVKLAAITLAVGLLAPAASAADYSRHGYDSTEYRLGSDDELYEWGNFDEADDGFALSDASEPVYRDDDDDDDDRDDVDDDRVDDDDDRDDDGRDG